MSAALTINDALVAALRAHAPTQAFLGGTPTDGRVYSGRAPDPSLPRYIVVASVTESGASAFGARGYADSFTLHLWCEGSAGRDVLVLHGLVESALSAPLTLVGHTQIRGRTTLDRTLVDRDGLYHHGIVTYRVHARVLEGL